MQAIILAGGFGSRLKNVIGDEVPKPMAPISSRPFLAYYLDYLGSRGVSKVLFSTHHLADVVSNYFGNNYNGIEISYLYENEPLGTGGAIKFALSHLNPSAPLLAMNGDTFTEIDIKDMYQNHIGAGAKLSIGLRQMSDCSRYGEATIKSEGAYKVIESFLYPGSKNPGWVSAGFYVISPDIFENYDLPQKFSFESDFSLPFCSRLRPLAYTTRGYFIDIGVPADYSRAQIEIPEIVLNYEKRKSAIP